MVHLRGPQILNRPAAGMYALVRVPLQLSLPVLAAQGLSFLATWYLVGWTVAAWIAVGFVAGAAVPLVWAGQAKLATQAFRNRFIDMVHVRGDLAVYGQ